MIIPFTKQVKNRKNSKNQRNKDIRLKRQEEQGIGVTNLFQENSPVNNMSSQMSGNKRSKSPNRDLTDMVFAGVDEMIEGKRREIRQRVLNRVHNPNALWRPELEEKIVEVTK